MGTQYCALLLLNVALGGTNASTPKVLSAFSPDNRTFATLSRGGDLRIWDVATGNIQVTSALRLGSDESPLQIGFDEQGKTCVLLHRIKRVCFWHLATSQKTPAVRWEYGSVCVAPVANRFAVAGKLFDASTGKHTPSDRVPGLVMENVFSPDGSVLAIVSCPTLAGNTSVITLLNTKTCKKTLQIGDFTADILNFQLRSLPVFSADSKLLAYTMPDFRRVHVHDLATNREVTWTSPGGRLLGFSRKNKALAVWDGNELRMLDPSTGKQLLSTKIHGTSVRDVILSPDGNAIAIIQDVKVEFQKLRK